MTNLMTPIYHFCGLPFITFLRILGPVSSVLPRLHDSEAILSEASYEGRSNHLDPNDGLLHHGIKDVVRLGKHRE